MKAIQVYRYKASKLFKTNFYYRGFAGYPRITSLKFQPPDLVELFFRVHKGILSNPNCLAFMILRTMMISLSVYAIVS